MPDPRQPAEPVAIHETQQAVMKYFALRPDLTTEQVYDLARLALLALGAEGFIVVRTEPSGRS